MNIIYQIGSLLSDCLFDGAYPGDIAGRHHLPKAGSFILACNHVSFFDPPAIGRHVPREIAYFARKSLFKPGLIGRILNTVNAIPVERDGAPDVQAVKRVLQALREGRGVLFFPEGTRSPDGTLQPALPGLAMIACKSAVPVVPARIFGSFESYGRQHRFPEPHGRISVGFGPPMPPKAFDPGATSRARYEGASKRILDAIAAIPAPREPGI